MAGGLKLAPLLTEIKVDINGFKSDMKEAAAAGISEAEKISKKMSGVTKAGEHLSKVGSTLTKSLTVPLISGGVAATKMAMDFESSFAKVSTLLDDNVVDFDKYKNDILEASGQSKIAVGEFSEAVYQSISAGVDQTKAIDFTTQAMKLAKGGFTDGAKAVDVLTTAINAYGYAADDAMMISDLLITTQNLGKTTVDELASSMGRVIPTANSYKVGLTDVTTTLAVLTKNGIATAEATTYYNSMLNELGKSGTKADEVLREKLGKGFSELMEAGVPLTECLKALKDEADANGQALGDMFGSAEAAKAALTIMKDDGLEYNDILKQMESSAGATQKAFEKIDATPAEQLSGALNELKNSAIKLGQSFIPAIRKVSDIISGAADKFSSLSDEQQENIIQWAGVAAAAGPVLSITGKVASGVSSMAQVFKYATGVIGSGAGASGITGALGALSSTALPVAGVIAGVGAAMYTAHEYGDLMNSTVLKSREEMSFMETVLADLTGTQRYSREELEQMGLVHKEFSDKISPEFQEAVIDATKTVQDFGFFLNEINLDGVLDEQEQQQFTATVEGICNSAIETINQKKEESQQGMKEMFLLDDDTITESEQRVLDLFNREYDTSVSEVTKLKDEIYAIRKKAVDEQRALNDEEIKAIEEKLAKIKELELEALGSNQEEILYAKNEFNARVQNIDLESASTLMQEKAKLREEEIVKIRASYDTNIALMKEKLSEATGQEKADLQEQINNHVAARDEKIKAQQELYKSYWDILGENNPKLLEEINRFNGDILTAEDKVQAERLSRVKDMYEGLDQITESGCYKIKLKNSDTWHNMAFVVDESTGEIIGSYTTAGKITAGVSEEIAQQAKELADAEDAEFTRISGAIDNTSDSITSLNDNPVEIKTNAAEAQREVEGFWSALQKITDKTVHINTVYTDAKHRTQNVPTQFYNGIDNIPYDGFHAVLHKNERVLTAEENKRYSNGAQIDYEKMGRALSNAVQSLSLKYNNREVARIYDELSRGH